MFEYPKTAQGTAKKASSADIAKEASGFTHPNLHRRIDPKEPAPSSDERGPREYKLTVSGLNSFRTTDIKYHDEESNDDDTP